MLFVLLLGLTSIGPRIADHQTLNVDASVTERVVLKDERRNLGDVVAAVALARHPERVLGKLREVVEDKLLQERVRIGGRSRIANAVVARRVRIREADAGGTLKPNHVRLIVPRVAIRLQMQVLLHLKRAVLAQECERAFVER